VDEFAAAGDARTRLVTCSSVQYTSGFRADLEALGRLCADRGWLFCVDGIQSVGAIPTDVKRCGIHFLSADSHKWMLGLVGIGIFYAGTGYANQLDPPLVGWRSTKTAFDFDHALLDLRDDALRFEEGNLPYPLIEGMGAAVRMLLEVGIDRVWARIRALNDYLVDRLQHEGHKVTSPMEDLHRSGVVTFIPRDGESAALVRHLQESGVIVSCRRGQVRVSPHFYNVEDELDRIVAAAT
jgi:selenocysteine lyase/cysteine desulfurase